MSFLDSLKYLNPFSNKFNANIKNELEIEREIENNSISTSEVEYDLMSTNNFDSDMNGYVSVDSISFNESFDNKAQRIAKYREMSYYPEISEALDIISDEAILQDHNGDIVNLKIKEKISTNLYKRFQIEFKYIVDDVLNTKDSLYDLFFKWLVEGELYIELVANNEKNKIIGYKVLPAFTIAPVYSKNGNIKYFLQNSFNNDNKSIPFTRNQISYVNWGRYGKNRLDPKGYLENSIKTYNQLKNLEDSLIVYRLVRAPERRVWNIEVGRLPTKKAQQYITKIIQKYKRQVSYNPDTGNIDATRNIQSLSEDFWFAKRDGQGTNIETIGGGQQLGELDDVRYFLSKMYKTLKLPRTRWDQQIGTTTYQSGKELDREELKFSLFISRLQSKFKKFILDVYFEHLKFKFKNEPSLSKYLKRSNFEIVFTPSNFFKEEKDLDLVEKRLNVLSTALQFTSNPDDPNLPLSLEYVLKNYFQMTEENYQINKKMVEKERNENKEESVEDAERQGEINKLVNMGKEEPQQDISMDTQQEKFDKKIDRIKKYLTEKQKG